MGGKGKALSPGATAQDTKCLDGGVSPRAVGLCTRYLWQLAPGSARRACACALIGARACFARLPATCEAGRRAGEAGLDYLRNT